MDDEESFDPLGPTRLVEEATSVVQTNEQTSDMDSLQRRVKNAKEFLNTKAPDLVISELEILYYVRKIEDRLDDIESSQRE